MTSSNRTTTSCMTTPVDSRKIARFRARLKRRRILSPTFIRLLPIIPQRATYAT